MKKSPTSERVVWTSFIVDLTDVILNVIVAVISGSVTMLAQALQGASDLTASAFLLIGLKRSKRKANNRYNFGYGREIYFWSLISSVIMFVITGLVAIHEGWQRIMNPEPISNVPLAIFVLLIGLGTNSYAFWLSYNRLKKNHAKDSITKAFRDSHLIETKITFILDLVGSSAAVFGLIAMLLYVWTGQLVYDGIGAIVIGISVAIFAIFLILESRDFLIGRSAQPEVEQAIEDAALAIEHVQAILDLRTMYIGSEELLVNMEVDVATHLKTEEIEQLMDDIKKTVKRKVPTVRHMQIELETA